MDATESQIKVHNITSQQAEDFIFDYDTDELEYEIYSYGDSTVVNAFHKNGSLKFEGTKIKRFKHGKWLYYNEKGFLVKTEKYHHGRKVQ